MLFKLSFLLVLSLARETIQYDACTNPSWNFQGYTYTTDGSTGERIWSHCKFPNPSYDYSRCGLSYTTGEHFICDPDNLITSEVNSVDSALQKIQTNTSTICSGPDGSKESYIVSVGLINRIRIPDFSSSSFCINDCGEFQPTGSGNPSTSQKEEIMKNFADYLRTGWGFGSCGNDITIFYCEEFGMVHISVGHKAASLVTESVAQELEDKFMTYKNQGRIADGLLVIIEELRNKLRGVTNAHIVLIVNMVALVAVGTFLVYILHFRTVDIDVWGKEKFWQIPDYICYFLSGIWIIDGLMSGVVYISNKAPYWATFISTLMAIICIVLYIYEGTIFTTYSNSGQYNLTSG